MYPNSIILGPQSTHIGTTLRPQYILLWAHGPLERHILDQAFQAMERVNVLSSWGLGYPRALRAHLLWLLGPKTILYEAFGLF